MLSSSSKEESDMCCWICGSKANSGEHRIKRTDLIHTFDCVNQKEPIFHYRKMKLIDKAGSVKSSIFKFDNIICTKCNNERTQPFDLAWDKLSSYLHYNWDEIKRVGNIDLRSVFPDNYESNMVMVQLFFIKILGCKIVESNPSYNLTDFSNCLLKGKENSSVYLRIRDTQKNRGKGYAAISYVYLCKYRTSEYLMCCYILSDISIDIIYDVKNSGMRLPCAYKPSGNGTIIKLFHY